MAATDDAVIMRAVTVVLLLGEETLPEVSGITVADAEASTAVVTVTIPCEEVGVVAGVSRMLLTGACFDIVTTTALGVAIAEVDDDIEDMELDVLVWEVDMLVSLVELEVEV